jgi:hypothetical protein
MKKLIVQHPSPMWDMPEMREFTSMILDMIDQTYYRTRDDFRVSATRVHHLIAAGGHGERRIGRRFNCRRTNDER